MKDIEYVYADAYIKTIENKMLTASDMQSLIGAESLALAKRILAERGWIGESTEEILKNSLKDAWSSAYAVCPKEAPIDILLYENDFHNLKTILKAQVVSADWHNMILRPSITEPEEIESAIKNKNFDELPPYIKDTAKEAYKLLTSTMDGQLTEIFIDKMEHLAVLKRAEEEKSEFLIGWAKLLIQLTDLKTAWRCNLAEKSKDFIKNALIFEKEELFGNLQTIKDYIKREFSDADVSSISNFEKWCDNKKLAYAKTAKADSFGFAPILAFLIGKSFEVQAVRIILACKENGMDEQIIRERLRDAYV